ncbi:MAG: hypothetical protein KC547_11200 [Anaerolineae bacterium]|nr:hypothetical protein [Anaerolineae bacterium]
MDGADSSRRDDRLLPITRGLAAIIVPILTVAFGMLYLFPARTDELFAWALRPAMSAMMLGAAYLGGAYFFTRVVLAKQWHTVQLGLLPVATFAGYLGVATLLHWDKFNHAHVSFVLWAILYLTLPFVIAFVWVRNRATDPRTPDADYPPLPLLVRRALMAVGALLVVVSLLLLLLPDVMIPTWPWTLSPLTARVMAALFVLPGVVALGIARDGRWSAARIIVQAQIGALSLIVLALVLARADIDWSRAVAWTFAGGMVVLGALLSILYVTMERRRGLSG